jgi:hypothetical protein
VPVFAFTPANGPLVRDWAVAVVTITAKAAIAAPTAINPFRVPCIAVSSSCGAVAALVLCGLRCPRDRWGNSGH